MASRRRPRSSPYSRVRLCKQDTVILNGSGEVSRAAQARKRYAEVVPTSSPVPPAADDTNPQTWSKATVTKRIKEDLGITRLPTSLKLPQLIRFYTENKGNPRSPQSQYPAGYDQQTSRQYSVMDVQLQKSITASTEELRRLMQSTETAPPSNTAPTQPQVNPDTSSAADPGVPDYGTLVGAVRHLQESVNIIANTVVSLHNQLGISPP